MSSSLILNKISKENTLDELIKIVAEAIVEYREKTNISEDEESTDEFIDSACAWTDLFYIIMTVHNIDQEQFTKLVYKYLGIKYEDEIQS